MNTEGEIGEIGDTVKLLCESGYAYKDDSQLKNMSCVVETGYSGSALTVSANWNWNETADGTCECKLIIACPFFPLFFQLISMLFYCCWSLQCPFIQQFFIFFSIPRFLSF